MAINKKSYKRPISDTKAIAERKEKRKKLVYRIVAVGLAGLLILGVAVSALVGM